MADSNDPPACACGFYGSPEFQGMCSKCFAESVKKKISSGEAKMSSSARGPKGSPTPPPPVQTVVKATATATIDQATGGGSSNGVAAAEPSTSEGKGDGGEMAEGACPAAAAILPVQKKKNRCYKCRAKLELAFTELGKCRCGYIYCALHRMPEEHECTYDHKGKGRAEALAKMVKPKRTHGTGIRLMDD